jgi:hypothetical protein
MKAAMINDLTTRNLGRWSWLDVIINKKKKYNYMNQQCKLSFCHIFIDHKNRESDR